MKSGFLHNIHLEVAPDMAMSFLLIEEIAHYVHTSLYLFPTTAVREVSRRFGEQARADPQTWQLKYDAHFEAFILKCCNRVGFELDALLREVIEQTVIEELRTAKDEGREPTITKSMEVSFGNAFECSSLTEGDDHETGSPEPAQESLAVHAVSMAGIRFNDKVKVFRLREPPIAVQLRARDRSRPDNVGATLTLRLVRWDDDKQMHIFNGRTGEPLPPLTQTQEIDLETLFALTPFEPFSSSVDIRKRPQRSVPASGDANLRAWKFVGDEPSVEQWLAGMGRMEQVEPTAEPEASRDAVRFRGGASQQQPAIGRIRMPKGVPFSALQVSDEEQEVERTEGQLKNDFAALMRRADQTNEGTEDIDDLSSEMSSQYQTMPMSFAALLERGRREERMLSSHDDAVSTTHPAKAITKPEQPLQVSLDSKDEDSGPPPTTHDTTIPDESFKTYNRRYANVDGIGLYGDAANQALWDTENFRPAGLVATMQSAKTREQLQRERAAARIPTSFLTGGSATMSVSDGSDPCVWKASGGLSSATPMSYADTQLGGSESWANKVVAAGTLNRSGCLIDTSRSDDGRSETPRFPPGLFPPLGLQHQQIVSQVAGQGGNSHGSLSTRSKLATTSSASAAPFTRPLVELPPQLFSHPTKSTSKVASGAAVPKPGRTVPHPLPVMGNLVDTRDEWPVLESMRPATNLPPQTALKPKIRNVAKGPVLMGRSHIKDNKLIERLQPDSEGDDRSHLHQTMRQKAQQKSKKRTVGKAKGKALQAKSKVVLELPEPIPLPKSEKNPKTEQVQKRVSTGAGDASVGPDPAEQPSVLRHKLLELLSSADTEKGPELVVQIGLILMDDVDDMASGKAAGGPHHQDWLDGLFAKSNQHGRECVHFLQALTKDSVDALFLLRLPSILSPDVFGAQEGLADAFLDPGDNGVNVEIVYEIDILDSENAPWTVFVDQGNLNEPTIKPGVRWASSVYVHFPLYIWDARVQLKDDTAIESERQVTDDLRAFVQTFVRTFDTPGEARESGLPAFEADIPDADCCPAFSISRVLAKRHFSQRFPLTEAAMANDDNFEPLSTATRYAVWHVDQIWDLHLCYNDSPNGEPSISAFANEESNMKAEGRLWWEASLRFTEGLDLASVELDVLEKDGVASQVLQGFEMAVSKIFEGLDCVGLGSLFAADPSALLQVPHQPQQQKAVKMRRSNKEREPNYVPFW